MLVLLSTPRRDCHAVSSDCLCLASCMLNRQSSCQQAYEEQARKEFSSLLHLTLPSGIKGEFPK